MCRSGRWPGCSLEHPRRCEESWVSSTSDGRSLGSPPRMRGVFVLKGRRKPRQRVTPAYAGRIRSELASGRRAAGHPRVCGAYRGYVPRPRGRNGSPPRMRGVFPPTCSRSTTRRVTPAYAGRILGMTWVVPRVTGHPRVCGAYVIVASPPAGMVGSPPRMRGVCYDSPSGLQALMMDSSPHPNALFCPTLRPRVSMKVRSSSTRRVPWKVTYGILMHPSFLLQ